MNSKEINALIQTFGILMILFVIIAVPAIWLFSTNPHTPAGHEGYVFESPRVWGEGGEKGSVVGPGNYGLSIWRNKVVNIDMRPSTYDEEFSILAKDDLNVSFRFHAVISVRDGTVQGVVQDFGSGDWYKRYVKEPFRTFVRDSVAQYDSREIKANRTEISKNVETRLLEHLEGTPFVLGSVVVGNIDYPESVGLAVEKKLAAQQALEEKEIQKKIAIADAEIRIEEARGIAEAQEIINSTLTQNYLQFEAIEAQKLMANSPNHTTVYIPVGANGIPLMQDVGK